MGTSKQTFKVSVTFEERSDGGLRAFSKEVPGFVLSHSNTEALFADVEPALSVILSEMVGHKVTVSPLSDLKDLLHQEGFIKPARVPDYREYAAQYAA